MFRGVSVNLDENGYVIPACRSLLDGKMRGWIVVDVTR